MSAIDDYLVRAHQQDLLRAACTRRPDTCTEARHHRSLRSWRVARSA